MKMPSERGSLIYFAALAALLLAVLVIVVGWWRGGLVFFGIVLLASGVFRFFISDDQIGILKVRSRWLDVSWLLTLGGSLVALALLVPPPIN